MSIYITEIELEDHLPALTLPAGTTSLLALIRYQGEPLDLLRLNCPAGKIEPDVLHKALKNCRKSLANVKPAKNVPQEPVSVIVCTRNRPNDLARCLQALKPHALAGHDIIVVDNAPGNEAAAELVAQYPYHYLREPRPGLNYARNCGAAAARRNIIAFTDDDCLPDKGWLKALSQPYTDPAVGAVTGLVMPFQLETEAQIQFEAYCANRRIFETRRYARPATPPASAGIAGMGANMSLRRTLWQKAGGFDPRLDAGSPTLSGGDTDMFAKILAQGRAIVYTPQALVWHCHRRQMQALRHAIFGYGVGLYSFLSKRLFEEGDLNTLITGPRWLVGPPLKALRNRMTGRPATPFSLLWLEFWGALHGPYRYALARRRYAQSQPAFHDALVDVGE